MKTKIQIKTITGRTIFELVKDNCSIYWEVKKNG